MLLEKKTVFSAADDTDRTSGHSVASPKVTCSGPLRNACPGWGGGRLALAPHHSARGDTGFLLPGAQVGPQELMKGVGPK